MILNNAVNAGGFIYCMAYWSPNERITYFNDGDGHYHQFVYVVDGEGHGEVRQTETSEIFRSDGTKRVGELLDLSDTKGMYHTTITKEHSLNMIMFNPIPDTRILDVEIVKGPLIKTITATDKRVTVVCITGPITANDKTLASLQHAKIFPGKTAELNLPENTVCALVLDK
jgi:hypothetical protein